MSDAARQKLKVSREGIVLIKSFEGFRPRAIQRAEGGWIIGYGHTLSAREGATVSEADAELLLRYDLLPVEASVNETIPGPLNQHQFDALVSFAFSVGVDHFVGSDVHQRLKAGAPVDAADAMMGWPEPILPETALRRRAAERALFVAKPGAPVALSDLLRAPLPPPPVPGRVEASATETAVESIAPIDPRGAAVAALLGEPSVRLVQDETSNEAVTPTFAPPAIVAEQFNTPSPSNDNPPVEAALLVEKADALPDNGSLAQSAATEALVDGEYPAAGLAATDPAFALAADVASGSAPRYAPYAQSMVGPLPDLQPATPHVEPASPAIDHSGVESVDAAAETDLIGSDKPPVIESAPADASEPSPPVEPMVYVAPTEPARVAELVLTPLENAPEPAFSRPMGMAEERSETDASETNLFGEDRTLTLGGSVMRHEIEREAPARFDWKGTAPLILMGGVGLVSFGAAMAAFRLAAEQSGGSELTIIGWVLALIGLGCVGVSSINLYRRFGLPGAD